MLKPTSIFPALLLAAFALFVAGCGGGDEGTTGSVGNDTSLAKSQEGAPSKAEFIKQAEAVCDKSNATRFNEAAKYRNRHKKELDALSPIASEEKIIRAIVLPSVQKEAEDLGALVPPKGDEKTIETIVAEVEKGVKKAKKNPYSISLEVPSEYPFRKVGIRIRSYGINACRNIA